jgi:thymidylate synthase ThyX
MRIEDLKHVRRPLPGGGEVVVLDTGALINAESEAMLQALHSRSIGGIWAHLEKLAKSGPEKFMSTFYVGYGHKSIGDCGSVTIFIEGVSLLAAKAVQDFMLYNGQEASTRYIDFAKQRFVDPLNNLGSGVIHNLWRDFYLAGVEWMERELVQRHPRKENEEEGVYKKAIKARTFDIMRAFLPAGAATNLAWHSELRHAADHIDHLRHHPLEEVRVTALALEDALAEMYPSSFQKKRYNATEDYTRHWMRDDYYYNDPRAFSLSETGMVMNADGVNMIFVRRHQNLLTNRPKMTELPKFVGECGVIQFEYLLDFGSFRDNQRHRAVIQRMPLLTSDYGFNPWYLDQLPEDLRKQANVCLAAQLGRLAGMDVSPEMRQYYLPMGMQVPCRLTGDLPALVYLVERRARMDVHPTMRKVAQDMGNLLLRKFGDFGLQLYMETEGDRFNYDRGKQDIVEKIP